MNPTAFSSSSSASTIESNIKGSANDSFLGEPASSSPKCIPTDKGLTGNKRKTTTPMNPTISPGTNNDHPHPYFNKPEAIKEPVIFPTDVWAFQMPMIKPLPLFPNQFPTTATTEGHPVD
uniref:Uncharacterized protein n=1 Tax=Opuntia streptacantha TaxID=393608 RepID=A0A7C9EHV9_OPUST